MKTILKVDFNDEDGRYYIAAGNGSSTSECAFACAVVARVFAKQGFVSDTQEFEEMIHKYLTDPQYDEVQDTDDTEDTNDTDDAEDAEDTDNEEDTTDADTE